MEILLATSNKNKAKEIQAALGRQVQIINLDLPEIQAIDVKDVIEQKARVAYGLVGKAVLVEDTGLAIHAWNGLPGALVRWFLEAVGNDGICRMLQAYEQLEATAETSLGYFDGENFFSFSGMIEGCITRSPRGNNGFGWDAIFVPKGWTKTFGEMTLEDGAEFVSMRKIAALKLKAFLDGQT
ncbi:non-canonical purine NTP pyrophosphatase [Candidatus Leptofilum sp.]|uniref:non-canonical purine NTP pyrophosphatase n=1 Tax=Candidatus Leptofilum sp. TaxID=3241576 RepID=UPI003B5C38F1